MLQAPLSETSGPRRQPFSCLGPGPAPYNVILPLGGHQRPSLSWDKDGKETPSQGAGGAGGQRLRARRTGTGETGKLDFQIIIAKRKKSVAALVQGEGV